ncbi:MAG: hypothetical protein LUD72_06465, partial [Bacteroidales bacterium]|nr:hypothetical protein [Bacteroidales bacterium]
INNLYSVSTIEECYSGDSNAPIPKIKNESGDWNVIGHPSRIIHITEEELKFFAKVFDKDSEWRQTSLPALYTDQYIEILNLR